MPVVAMAASQQAKSPVQPLGEPLEPENPNSGRSELDCKGHAVKTLTDHSALVSVALLCAESSQDRA